jgi:hypothetical protein
MRPPSGPTLVPRKGGGDPVEFSEVAGSSYSRTTVTGQ